MELVRTMMLNILAIVFLTTVLDLLLPEGTLRGYVKMTMGFFVVLTLLQPIMQLSNPQSMLQAWQLTMPNVPTAASADALTVQSDAYAQQAQQWEQLYSETLEEQVRSLLLLTTDAAVLQVHCTVQGQCLERIALILANQDGLDTTRIAQGLAGYYGLATEQIEIKLEEAGQYGMEEAE